MPILFKNIRRKLAAESRFDKYLRYAIGEILLVVIGILIALQVNNWNENRKVIKQEIQIYRELKSNLLQTKNIILKTVSQQKENLKSNQQLIYDIHNKKPYSDTIYNLFARTGDEFQIIPQTSAFENLKNIGFSILSNDSLRVSITNLFQLDLKRLDDESKLNNSRLSTMNLLFPYQNKYLFADFSEAKKYGFKHSDTITVYKLKIKDYNQFLTDNDLIKTLQLTLYNRSQKVDLEIETVHKIDKVIKGIDDELESGNK